MSRTRRRRWLGAAAAAAALLLGGRFFLRCSGLLQAAAGLIVQSDQFPSEYSTGSGAAHWRLVVLGDSTAVGTGADHVDQTMAWTCGQWLTGHYGPGRVVNLGKVGARLHDVVADQLPRLAGLHPDFVLVSVGANDVTHATAPAAYAAELDRLLAGIQGVRTSWVATTPDMSYVPAIPWPLTVVAGNRAARQNEILFASDHTRRVVVFDLFHKGALDARVHAHYYAGDEFHPSAAGYAVWGAVLRRAMAGM